MLYRAADMLCALSLRRSLIPIISGYGILSSGDTYHGSDTWGNLCTWTFREFCNILSLHEQVPRGNIRRLGDTVYTLRTHQNKRFLKDILHILR